MPENTNSGLRAILVGSYVIGFALCIAAGAVSGNVLPAIGLIPMTGSFLSSIVILVRKHRKPDNGNTAFDAERSSLGMAVLSRSSSGLASPLFLCLWDLFLAASLITILVCTWVFFDFGDRWYNPTRDILTVYATVPLLTSFFIHLYLAGRGLGHVGKALRTLRSPWPAHPSECPNCHARYHPSTGHVSPVMRGPQGYTLARPSEEEQQPLFRDNSFDGDAAIQPDEAETSSKAS
ncbi:hypothetical protein ACO1O0_006948 [Amphichorda felina]